MKIIVLMIIIIVIITETETESEIESGTKNDKYNDNESKNDGYHFDTCINSYNVKRSLFKIRINDLNCYFIRVSFQPLDGPPRTVI